MKSFKETIEEGHSRINSVTAHNILTMHQAHGDYHALPSSSVDGLLKSAKEHGYKKSKGAPGSTGRMFHQHLTRLASHTSPASHIPEFATNSAKAHSRITSIMPLSMHPSNTEIRYARFLSRTQRLRVVERNSINLKND